VSRLRRMVETLRHARASQAGHRLVRALSGEERPRDRGAVPAVATLPPLPPEAGRPAQAPDGRSDDDAILARPTPYARARRILAAVEARGAGRLDGDIVLLRDLDALARRPPWDERGLALACAGAALHRGGAAFSGAAARAWRARGASILSTCAAAEVLPDGLHVERSPVRHAQLLELLLTALSTAEGSAEPPPKGVRASTAALAASLPLLVLPDGELLRARDGVPGEALPLRQLLSWAARHVPTPAATTRTRLFPSAGLAILGSHDGRGAATLWAAPPCPPDRPLDRFADALSTEVVLDGFRVIAAAGSIAPDDAAGSERARRPGACAGPLVDGVATSGTGIAPGWARRLETSAEDDGAYAEAYAGGLGGPARGVVLRRVVRLADGPCVVVVDEAVGDGEHELAWAWPLAPGLSARVVGHGAVLEGLGRTFAFAAPGLALSVEDGLFARGPGLGVRREVLWTRTRRRMPTRVVHAIASGSGPLHVTATPIPGGELRIEVEGSFGRTVAYVPLGRRP